jgi:hypothetical protein
MAALGVFRVGEHGGHMKLRSICIGLGVAGASIAMAAGLLQFAEGRGRAADDHGRHATFHFNARKATNGDVVRKNGTAMFEITDREFRGAIRINMRELHDITVEERVARFTGPGSIRLARRGGEVVERRGRVFVVADDNRRPDGPRIPRDRVSVRFEALEGNLTYSFQGIVGDGDLAVGKRRMD